jgi:hypothetical protein
MERTHTTYEVIASHPGKGSLFDWTDRPRAVRVTHDGENGIYCDAALLGMSRTYRTQDAKSAIARFLSEHSMSLISAKAV